MPPRLLPALLPALLLSCAALLAPFAQAAPAFPGAQGAAADTPGGRGGKIIRVTTLAASGPGSLLEALRTPGPRTVVFEVGGVIDFGQREIAIREPFLTVAGQTAPSPGITLARVGIIVQTHDVVLRHLRVRTGVGAAHAQSKWSPDALATGAAANVIVDHCSLSWAIDENLSSSGERFRGATPDDWRANTSHNITFSHNIIAEGLSRASHPKGEHSKGSLIHDNVTGMLIVGNLYASNHERNPLFKGGARGMVVNNLIYNPRARAVHYNLVADEWEGHPFQTGQLALIGNVLRAGPSSAANLTLFQMGGQGDLALYEEDNLAFDRAGKPLAIVGRLKSASGKVVALDKPALPPGVAPLAAAAVQASVLANAGARPWDRDAVDARIVGEVVAGAGQVIDSEEQIGGQPQPAATRAPFNEAEWDLASMSRRTP
ncbi:MAG: hypothetical protein ABIT83_07875 [Massilia sp.]